MKKGISFYFGFNATPEKRVKIIQEAGFDTIITAADARFEQNNGDIESQIKLFKKYNLSLSSLHMRYIKSELPSFWLNNKTGERMLVDLIDDIKIAAKYGFTCVVVHLFNNGRTTEIGLKRLNKALDLCQEYNVPLAIENIDDPKLFKQIMKLYDDNPYVKMCYDSGHNHFVDPEFDYLTIYRDKIICLHLHDNMGGSDEHTLNKYGNIDWDSLAQKLAKIPHPLSLDYEILLHTRGNETIAETANETYTQAVELENMINKYKN